MNYALSGKLGAIYVQTTDAPVAFTSEATTTSDHKSYTITDRSKRYFDEVSGIAVHVDSIIVIPSYINYVTGTVYFDTTQTGVVTISGHYLQIAQRGGFTGWKMEVVAETKETTTFEDNGHKTFLATLDTFTASGDSYWFDYRFKNSLGQKMVFVFYVDTVNTGTRYEGFGFIDKNSINLNVADIVKETINIQGHQSIVYLEN